MSNKWNDTISNLLRLAFYSLSKRPWDPSKFLYELHILFLLSRISVLDRESCISLQVLVALFFFFFFLSLYSLCFSDYSDWVKSIDISLSSLILFSIISFCYWAYPLRCSPPTPFGYYIFQIYDFFLFLFYILNSFDKIFYFFTCFMTAHNCSLKHFNDHYFKILVW